MESKIKNLVIEQENIDFFENTVNQILNEVFDLDPVNVLVTDLTSVGDFSITQEEFDEDIALIKKLYGYDMKAEKQYSLLSLCRFIESKSKQNLH